MIVIIFFVSLFSGLLLAYVLRKLNIVDKPDNSRKFHKNPTPPAGGLVIMPICAYLMYLHPNYVSKTQIIFLTMLFIMGFLDDLFNLPVLIKLLTQLLGAFLIVDKSNIPIYYSLITTVLYTVYINSVNFIDNSQGTCLSFLAFSFLFLYIMTLNQIFAYLLFSVLALLLLNLGLENIFLGNSGTFFIGGLLVVAIDKFCQPLFFQKFSFNAYSEVLIYLFLLIAPLMDFIYVTVRRIIAGDSIFKADNRHLSFTMERIFNSSIYALFVWNLLLYCIFFFNVILIKDNIPYIYNTPK